MIRILRIDHIVLRTGKMAEMIRFYCEVLGCTVERQLSPEVGLVQLRAGDALIDLVNVDSELGRAVGPAPAAGGRNLDHLCLHIEPAKPEQVLEWLEQKGVKAGDFTTRYGATGFGPSVYIQDPDANTVELRIAGTAEHG